MSCIVLPILSMVLSRPFIIMNTNEAAKFIHGNEEAPIRVGSLVSFLGSMAHHTLVNKGHYSDLLDLSIVASMERWWVY
jgi:hypothetical protein